MNIEAPHPSDQVEIQSGMIIEFVLHDDRANPVGLPDGRYHLHVGEEVEKDDEGQLFYPGVLERRSVGKVVRASYEVTMDVPEDGKLIITAGSPPPITTIKRKVTLKEVAEKAVVPLGAAAVVAGTMIIRRLYGKKSH